jgi:hypothetical protein
MEDRDCLAKRAARKASREIPSIGRTIGLWLGFEGVPRTDAPGAAPGLVVRVRHATLPERRLGPTFSEAPWMIVGDSGRPASAGSWG